MLEKVKSWGGEERGSKGVPNMDLRRLVIFLVVRYGSLRLVHGIPAPRKIQLSIVFYKLRG